MPALERTYCDRTEKSLLPHITKHKEGNRKSFNTLVRLSYSKCIHRQSTHSILMRANLRSLEKQTDDTSIHPSCRSDVVAPGIIFPNPLRNTWTGRSKPSRVC